MKKQVGPIPITAKLKRTTKGGIVQPQIKTLQSPAQKALVGKQHNLPNHLKAKIEAAPESPAKKETRLTGRQIQERNARLTAERKAAKSQAAKTAPQLKPGQTGYYRQEKRKGRDAASIRKENYAAAKGISNAKNDPHYGISPSSSMPTSQPVPDLLKGPSKPRKQTKTVTTIKRKPVAQTTKPTASKDIKPKVKTKAETSIKASKLRAKGEKALAEGKTGKAQRLAKRYTRKTKRDENKAARQEKRANKKGLRKTKRSLIKQEVAKLRAAKKEIRSYKDY
jgi:hypothetical protein